MVYRRAYAVIMEQKMSLLRHGWSHFGDHRGVHIFGGGKLVSFSSRYILS